MKPTFVHLHVHTTYSIPDGACHLDPLCQRAAELGMPALAMTGHGAMYGMIEFVTVCKRHGIHPIIGCEMYINATSPHTDRSPRTAYHHLVLLAETDEGYRNLVRLCSLAHLEGFNSQPRIDKELLRQNARGLIGLSACRHGEINELLVQGDLDRATQIANQYAEILGADNFFLEMQDHGIAEQKVINVGVRELCRRTGLRSVVTNDVHYLHRSQAATHEVLLAIQADTVMSDPKRPRYPGDQLYLKSRAEMDAVFPDDAAALDRTVEIAERCQVMIEPGRRHIPQLPSIDRRDRMKTLSELAHEGVRKKYDMADPYSPADAAAKQLISRLNSELGIIEKMGYIDYFLVVGDYVRYARSRGVWVSPGYGLTGSSLVAYVLGITEIDPIRYQLVFERLLNPERVSPPVMSVEICAERRHELFDYLADKYGVDRVAQIGALDRFRPRTAILAVARALEIPRQKAGQLARLVPDDPWGTLTGMRESIAEFGEMCGTDADLQRIMPHAESIDRLCRHAGVHASGIVIGDQSLVDLVPLCRDKDGRLVTQYEEYEVQECGLIKLDILGSRTISKLSRMIEFIQRRGIALDLSALPLNDSKTFELLNRGDTKGVFALESAGLRRLIQKVGVHNIEELSALIALYRPGPMEMLPDYSKRKMGKEQVAYAHPLLEPILRETYGVFVYQEQVILAVNALAGYSLGPADLLRRAMGKKMPRIMAQERVRFVEACGRVNRIPPEQAEALFEHVAEYAGCTYHKAHAIACGVVAYQMAYIKAHYPEAFL